MGLDHSAKTEAEFKASASPMLLDLMKILHHYNPNVIDAAQALTEILAGCVGQVKDKDDRDKLRELIIGCLHDIDHPDSVDVDLSDLIIPTN